MGKIANMKESPRIRRNFRGAERLLVHDYSNDQCTPPLRVTAAGVSRFAAGDGFWRINRAHFSMNIITRGCADWQQGTDKGIVETGEVFLAHVGQNQSFTVGKSGIAHKRFIIASGPVLDTMLRATGLGDYDVVQPRNPGYVVSCFRQVYGLMQKKEEGFTMHISALVYAILLHLASSIRPEFPLELRRAISFIRANLQKCITLEEICGNAHCSKRSCNRLFRQFLQMSPMQYVIDQRITWAQTLLLDTVLSVKKIAQTVGYEDQLYFSSQFKERVGMPPKKYREKNCGEQILPTAPSPARTAVRLPSQ